MGQEIFPGGIYVNAYPGNEKVDTVSFGINFTEDACNFAKFVSILAILVSVSLVSALDHIKSCAHSSLLAPSHESRGRRCLCRKGSYGNSIAQTLGKSEVVACP